MTIHFHVLEKLSAKSTADLLVIPFWESNQGPISASKDSKVAAQHCHGAIAKDFTAAEGMVCMLYPEGKSETRVALLGLGKQEQVTTEQLRRCYGALLTACRDKAITKYALVMPEKLALKDHEVVRGVCEGLLSANYAFDALKRVSRKEPKPPISDVTLVGAKSAMAAIAQECACVADSVYFVRDLVNGNADDVTPQFLSAVANGLAKELPNTRVTIFDRKAIEKHQMGLLLAVNRGSARDPAFIILEYRGNPRSSDHTVIVGKGVTFDTGGLNLKATGFMEEMKDDMAGAAAALGTVRAAAQLGLKVNVTAVIPTTENSIGSRSYKPGDVYISYSGRSVEIGNTDAEGRLILADALAYACDHLKPTRLINIATLTGSIVIALGQGVCGLMSNNDALAGELEQAGKDSYERVWRMPLVEEYRKKLNSDLADIKNIGGRAGGPILAGLFLKEFVGETPWAHLDIAGPAFLQEAGPYLPKHASGFGVRLLVQLLQNGLPD